jgi:hypothetical protein
MLAKAPDRLANKAKDVPAPMTSAIGLMAQTVIGALEDADDHKAFEGFCARFSMWLLVS